MNKGLTLLAGAVLAGTFATMAVPAKPGLRIIEQPDGSTITAELRGDEYCSFYVTPDGLPMRRNADGYLRYVSTDGAGNIVLTANKAEVNTERSFRALSALNTEMRREMNAVPAASAAEAVVRNARALSEDEEDVLPQFGMGLMRRQNFPTTGDIKSVVILVSYTDVDFTTADPHQYFYDMLNKEDFDEYGAVGSARQYFVENSLGQFNPQFDLYGPVKLSHERAYYGAENGSNHDIRPSEMAIEALAALDSQVDFSQYDMDGDGIIDNVYIIYAGQGQATYGGPDTVWPHSSTISNGPVHDGVRLARYTCSNEWEYGRPDGIGTFIHEFSHVLGLPDLYSTTYVNTVTPGEWSIMDQGPYNGNGMCPPFYTAYERNALGWIRLKKIDGPASIDLLPIQDNDAYIIQTLRDNEFFLFEFRNQDSWDAYVPNYGMLVWHVDYNSDIYTYNTVNNDENHQYVDIVEANSNPNSSSSSAQKGYVFPGTTLPRHSSITPTTTPNLTPWIGPVIAHELTDIKVNAAKRSMSFNVDGGLSALEAPVATAATAMTASGFTANWNAVEGASKYLLTVSSETASTAEDVNIPFGTPSDNSVVLPEGWSFTGASSDVYTTKSFCGQEIPSLRFAESGIELASPLYEGEISNISFFLRAAAVSDDAMMSIQGRSSEDAAWKNIETITDVNTLNTTGQTIELDIAASHVRQIKLAFYTTRGRVGLDDLVLSMAPVFSNVLEGYNRLDAGEATEHAVTVPANSLGKFSYFVEAVDANGSRTAASNIITVELENSGVEDILTSDKTWNVAVNGMTATYSGTPGATISAVNVSGATVATAVSDASGAALLQLPAPGFYIISAPEGTIKTIAR